MAIVNNLSASNQKRDTLVNNRNGFTYAANITILSFALVLFSVIDDKINQFRYLCLIALFIGSFSSVFYIVNINEVRLT
jgi:Na+/melibiose symporter-like transporter